MRGKPAGELGQSTVELALCLPFVVLVIGAVVQMGLLASDEIRIWHAAREAVRAASVEADPAVVRKAAARAGLEPLRVQITPTPVQRRSGHPVTVRVSYSPAGFTGLVAGVLGRRELSARATMVIEQP
ncbi:MAG TPA: TadE family protein [Actinomycetota bacterium]|jgi:Flp pilus assembly protein TadG|nr:TadE family protein [Actinomycetota bacterium]